MKFPRFGVPWHPYARKRRATEKETETMPEETHEVVVMMVTLFALGRTVATPGALAALERLGKDPTELYSRHVTGDWGDLGEDDRRANERAVKEGDRILSAYVIEGEKFYVCTEHDRSSTCLMRAEDY